MRLHPAPELPAAKHRFPGKVAAILLFFVQTLSYANTSEQPAALHIIAKLADKRAAEAVYRQTLLNNEFDHVRLVQGPLTIRTLSLGVYPEEPTAHHILDQLKTADISAQIRVASNPRGYVVDVVSAFDERTFDDAFQRVHKLGFQHDVLVTTAALDDDVFFIMGANRPPPIAAAPIASIPEAAPESSTTPVVAPMLRRKPEFDPWQWLRKMDTLALNHLAATGEFDHWDDTNVAATGNYFSGDLSFKWKWTDHTALFFGTRVDMFEQSGATSFQKLTTDYDSTYWQWHDEDQVVTIGQQQLIFGVDDRDSLANRLVIKDLSRAVVESSVRRKTWPSPSLRWVYGYEGLFFDVGILPFFDRAKLPSYSSMWSPVDPVKGRLLNRRTPGELSDVIKGSTIGSDHPAFGGAGFQVSYSESEIRHALSLQYMVDSEPYLRIADSAAQTLRAGGDAAAALAASQNQALIAYFPVQWALTYCESYRTWRFELALLNNVPVTGSDYSTLSAQAVDWLFGADFSTPDPATSLYLTLSGRRLSTPSNVLDRQTPTHLGGNVRRIFLDYPWRFDFQFSAGLDTYEFHLAPTVTYTGTRQFEISVGAHYFYGDAYTLAGYHSGQNLLILRWQTRF